MEQSRCPECGKAIGGGHHSLLANNSRATEFEAISGRHGAAESPWNWAAGA